MSLRHVEWQGKDLLSVTAVHSNFIHHFFVFIQGLHHLVNKFFVGVNLDLWTLHFVNQLLDFYWISVSLLDLFRIAEGNIFKTVDLSETPEHIVSVLASSLNLEQLINIHIVQGFHCNVVKHLILCEGFSSVKR